MSEKSRYSDEELNEFKVIILARLEKAKKDLSVLKNSVKCNNGTEDTDTSFNALEEACSCLSKAEANQLIVRQELFIQRLGFALARVENKTYGICRKTGKLIPRERLLANPIATTCIEVKNCA